MRTGISLLRAGIMAAIGFVSKLFSDGSLMLREFGQKALGALSEAAETVVNIFKNQILYWASWLWAKEIEYVLLLVKKMLSKVDSIGVYDDYILHVAHWSAVMGTDMSVEAVGHVEEHWVELLDAELWCLIINLTMRVNRTETRISSVLTLDILIYFRNETMRLSDPQVQPNPRCLVDEDTYAYRGIENGWKYLGEHRKEHPYLRTMRIIAALTCDILYLLAGEIADAVSGYVEADRPSIVDLYAYHIFIPYTLASISLGVAIQHKKARLFAAIAAAGSLERLFLYLAVLTKCLESYLEKVLFWGAIKAASELLEAIREAAVFSIIISIVYVPFLGWVEGALSLALTIIGIGSTSPFWKMLSLLFAASGCGFIPIPDEEERRWCMKELMLYVCLALCLVALMAEAHRLSSDLCSKADIVKYNRAEPEPPRQSVALWDPVDAGDKTLRFRVDIEEAGDKKHSKVFDFGILVVEKNPKGRDGVGVYPYLSDPISGRNYTIPINFKKLIGDNATVINGPSGDSWGGGLNDSFTEYEIKGRVHGSGFLYLVDDKRAYVNGTITFEDWEQGKYYIIVWCVDEYGNARIVAYDPGRKDPPREKRYTVLPGNIGGYMDPENRDILSRRWENDFYTIGEEPYVPYIKLSYDTFQECLVLYLAPRIGIRLDNTTIEGADGYWCYFALRYKTIFQYGTADAGGVKIRFFTENAPTGMIDLWILIASIYIVFIAISRRRKR